MAQSEEEQPLVQGPPAAGVAGSHATAKAGKGKGRTNGATLRGLVVTAFVSMGVFIMAALASRTIMWEDAALSAETVYGSGADASNASADALSGLIPPYNGTHPTLTTTEDCTGGKFIRAICVLFWVTVTGACVRKRTTTPTSGVFTQGIHRGGATLMHMLALAGLLQ